MHVSIFQREKSLGFKTTKDHKLCIIFLPLFHNNSQAATLLTLTSTSKRVFLR